MGLFALDFERRVKMKFSYILLALVALFASVNSQEVHVLKDDTFDSFLGDNEHVLVKFYAPWCGHCKSLAPEFDSAASALHESGSSLKLAKIDCTVEKTVCGKYSISGYPTVKLFSGASFSMDYDGQRTSASIVTWMKSKTGPAFIDISEQKELDEFVKSSHYALAAFDDSQVDAFTKVARAYSTKFVFARITNADLVKSVLGSNKIKLVRGDDTFTSESDDFAVFMADNAYPPFEEVDGDSYGRASKKGLPIAIVFHDEKDLDATTDQLKKLSEDFKGKFSFLYGSGQKFKRNIQSLGATGDVFPTAIVLSLEGKKPVAFDENVEFNLDTLSEFLNGYLSGTVKEFKKSEKTPDPATKNGLTTLVGNNIEEILNDPTKDVLVKFYAPWCGHCKTLAPIWDSVAEANKDNDKLVIAKMDATANWYPSEIDIKGYPTLLLFKAGDKKPTKCEASRTQEGIQSWLEENATTAFPAGGDKDEL